MKGKGRKGGQDKRGGGKGGKKGNYRGVKNNRRPSEPIKKKKDAQAGGKKTFCFNRYRDKQRVEEELKKKQMLEEKIEKEYQYSESDEEVNDPLQQLMSTFKNGKGSNKSRAVESSDESESEEEEMEADTSNLAQDSDEQIEGDSDEGIEDVSGDEVVENEEMSDGSDLDEVEEEESGDFNVSLQLETSGEEDEDTDNQIPPGQNLTKEIEVDEEQEVCPETEKDDADLSNNDPFLKHLRDDLHDSLLQSVSKKPHNYNTTPLTWPCLGKLVVQIPKTNQHSEEKKAVSKFSVLEEKNYTEPGNVPSRLTEVDWDKLCVKKQIQENLGVANKTVLFKKDYELEDKLTPLQKELFAIMNNYQDLYYPERTFVNADEIRYTYCLHALNHLIKTRTKILHHNAKLSKKTDVPDEFRDQGLVRPKVIIVVPFKHSAYKIIKLLIELLVPGDSSQVVNKNRFEDDFTGNELLMPKKNPKPEDYEVTFSGNTDDTFRMGLSITKKTLKLYSDFYSSDLIIASPLGLRVIVGAEGEEERDFDFLASVELLILDQTEIFLMQNWDHMLHVLDHFHLQPKKTHGTDFSRLRSWAVNGWTKYYRQTLVFSAIALPEISSLFNKKCFNYAGRIRVHNPIEAGAIRQVAVQVPQVFRRIEAKDPVSAIDARFEYFVKEILPQHKDSIMAHTMIYVPSYFDFVRIRNYFKKEDLSFVQICEYSKDAKVARARDMFFHSEGHFLLYSERFHFFRRMRIKGIRHIIFYQPPIFANFYSELCNLMQEGNQNKYGGSESNMTVTVLYTKYDLQQLSAVVSSERTAKMCQSDKNIHMFMTGE